MDVRVLRYFLTVAREGSITKAAEVLHLTQPTLSRQLMDLENELGTILFNRGNRNVTLTAAGILYQQRIQEIVALLDKADREVAEQEGVVRGTVSIGCVETTASLLLPDVIEAFNTKHPLVKYELYCANGDDIRDRIDSGHLDIGILVEPVETAKYESFPLPFQDVWGVLMRKDDPLAIRESIRVEDIADSPLFMSSRRIIKDEIESWFEENANSLNVLAHHNLVTNTMLLVERGLGYAISLNGAYLIRSNANLCFVPLSPERKAGHVLAWKKNRIFSQSASLFLEYIKNNIVTFNICMAGYKT